MYKKITCAFCLVISIFIIAVAIYLFLNNAELFSDKPPQIKLPKVSLYVVNETGHERLLHKTPNSEYILDIKSLESEPELEFNPLSIFPSSESIHLRRKRLRIRCHSNYPVQLKYIGFGNVTEAKNYNRRQIQDFDDRSTYSFITELEFSNVDEGITGKYDCQIHDDQNELLANTFIFVYASGSKTFVSHSTRELISEPGSFIEVPCPVSHPSKAISLISVLQLIENTTVEKEVEKDRIRHYDPRRGFTLYPDNYGLFYCKDEDSFEASGRVNVFLPLNIVVKGRSLRLYSQNVDNKHHTLKLECRAKEPVELKFYNFIRFVKQPREFPRNDSQEYPFAVRIKINKDWFRGNVSIVDCQTKKDRRVIKTWKFLRQDLPKDDESRVILQQPVRQMSYECCSNQNDNRPILRTYPCHTPTECELRKTCLSIDPLRANPSTESCPLLKEANEDIYQSGEKCTMLQLTRNSTGIIRCLLDSVMKDYTYFTGKEMDGMYSSMALINKKKIEPSAVLKINKIYRKQSPPLVRFECQGPKLLFASGFQWGIQKLNEPIKYLTNEGVRVESDSVLHNEWIDHSYLDNTNKRFYCFAPLITPALYGQQWVNVSITF